MKAAKRVRWAGQVGGDDGPAPLQTSHRAVDESDYLGSKPISPARSQHKTASQADVEKLGDKVGDKIDAMGDKICGTLDTHFSTMIALLQKPTASERGRELKRMYEDGLIPADLYNEKIRAIADVLAPSSA